MSRLAHRFGFLILFLLLLTACAPQPTDWRVITHPDGPLYVGDWVSFEILAPPGEEVDGKTVTVSFGEQMLGSATFTPSGIGRRVQATLWWVWDTRQLSPGRYRLDFRLDDKLTWSKTIRLHPAEQVPPPEPATWQERETECCRLYYISGTDAARDIEVLAKLVDAESRTVCELMGAQPVERIIIYFMPRIIGHGGFAWNGLYLSYLDDGYVGGDIAVVLRHEFVHAYDNQLGGTCRLSIFQEGLATLLTGGHFKREPILARASALLDLGWYLPLEPLTDDFYNQQHEIGYLQAAALVEYLRAQYGAERFDAFYRSMDCTAGETPSKILDSALRRKFGLTLVELDQAFRAYLEAQPDDLAARQDLETTVAYMDTVRRYQRVFDPSAYFLTAWLPDGEQMRQRGIVADFTRRPQRLPNLYLESQLRRAHAQWFAGEYEAALHTLERINHLLTWAEQLRSFFP
ncbi:MAG: hypothetical protein N2049_05190 [Anaerolineales bacterium]|nr:hypothetical protein [Anaerolineales bacterium]MCX7608596.1 hypothetical protein [Anaerolineales bacterium]MDW8226643.1 hypothetical protein [Anaerolineales bacterium]